MLFYIIAWWIPAIFWCRLNKINSIQKYNSGENKEKEKETDGKKRKGNNEETRSRETLEKMPPKPQIFRGMYYPKLKILEISYIVYFYVPS